MMGKIFSLAFWIGCGFVCLALFEGTPINWSSAWTYAWIFAWPLALFVVAFKWIAIMFSAGVVIALCIVAWEKIR